MFELSFIEVAVIAIAAILILKPEDIPTLVRKVSALWRELSGVSAEIKSTFTDALEESGVTELKDELTSEFKQNQKFIIDQNGEMQEIFDISDILEAEGKAAPKMVEDEGVEGGESKEGV